MTLLVINWGSGDVGCTALAAAATASRPSWLASYLLAHTAQGTVFEWQCDGQLRRQLQHPVHQYQHLLALQLLPGYVLVQRLGGRV
jgi:hypothetical protein